MTSVLVTGGAGFVGSHIVDEYVDADYDVTTSPIKSTRTNLTT